MPKNRITRRPRGAIYAAAAVFMAFLALSVVLAGCTPNHPYRPEERGAEIFYTTFNEPPKHLDPARAYSSDEYAVIAKIYEPPLQYHYLKRPYTLVPLTAESVPAPAYYDSSGGRLPETAPVAEIHRSVYEITVREGLVYQDHPAFATDAEGEPLYRDLTGADLTGVVDVSDFPEKATRRVLSDDYIHQIKRLADPRVGSPILSILEKYILGMREFSEALSAELEETRKARREAAGAAYNQIIDERENPIVLDYDGHPFPGVERVDDRTYRVILKTKYPQFVYWLAMPFFAPMPEEAVRFYEEPELARRNITIDRYPVGTGPYMMEVYNPNMEMVLVENPRFRGEPYPAEGEPGDRAWGLLDDAGKAMPFVKRVVYKLEKEAIPRWNKFLQGYYDNSGLTSESFDQAVTLSSGGEAQLTEPMREKGIALVTSVQPSTWYGGFNMLDDVVGGYTERARLLRQAISIALDFEEYVEIFNNGRGVPSMGPVPPGIFGHVEGREGMNPFVYRWDPEKDRPVRRSIEYARELMKKAGYPGGRDADGRPLVITFDNPMAGAQFTSLINWYIKKLRALGIQLENRTTDYNRFREKMMSGNFQFFVWGWNADYPDPENFFFLLAGSNSKAKYGGENVANYANDEFDRLFKKMENMDNTPERLEIIRRMTEIAQRDAPWAWGYHPVGFGLYHKWVGNVKSNAMANNTMKYIRLDAEEREALRREWNSPVLWPVAVLAAVLVIGSIPAIMSVRRKKRSHAPPVPPTPPVKRG